MFRKFLVEIEVSDDPQDVVNASYLQDTIDDMIDGQDDIRYDPISVYVTDVS